MEPVQIGLVDKTAGAKVPAETIQRAVVALNIQVAKHLRKYWDIAPAAIVRHFRPDDNIPFGVWEIQLVDELKQHEGGFHSTDHYQPYAKVAVGAGGDDWTISASHELLEMLVDPSGNKIQIAPVIELTKDHTIADGHTTVGYLLEICDPCEAHTFAYQIEGVWVSDFVTPDFYACGANADGRYSFRHNIVAPRRIRPGGYITWIHPEKGELQQILWLDSDAAPSPRTMQFNVLGYPANNMNLRAFSDSRARHKVHQHRGKVRAPLMTRQEIQSGHTTRRKKHDVDHWVTFPNDGIIERKIWKDGVEHPITCVEIVRAYEPVFRPAGTDHTVCNIGSGPVFFEKDEIPPR